MSSIPEMCTVTSPKKHWGCRDVNDIDDYKNHTENYTIDLLQWLTSVDVMAALDAFSFLGRMSHCHLVLLSTKWLVVRVHPALHKQARTWHVNGHPKAAQNGPRGSKVWNDWPMLTTNHHSPHRLELHTMVGSASLLGVRDSRAAWSLRDQPTIQCLFQIASTRVPCIFEEQTLHSKQELLSLECFVAAATHSLDQIITRITNNGYTCCSTTKVLSLQNEPSFNLDVFLAILQNLTSTDSTDTSVPKTQSYHRRPGEEES